MGVVNGLLGWYECNRRSLPWRTEPRDPYQVLVSETMLQQTQVDRVVPLFESFIRRFPSLSALAAAREDEVLEAWSGLGYYRRARALHALARRVYAAEGVLPADPDELETLPGVGPYTAAAVASLAFGVRAPVLDGNVLRVGARVLAETGNPRAAAARKRILEWVRGLMTDAPPGLVNESLMELGATVCRPVSPACARCPLAADCRARAQGIQDRVPPPRQRRRAEEHRWVASCPVADDGRWLLRRIDQGPILAGLWLPPFTEGGEERPVHTALQLLPWTASSGRVCAVVRHSVTHRRIRIVPVHVPVTPASGLSELSQEDGWLWVDPLAPAAPTSSLLVKLRRAVEEPAQALPFIGPE